MATVTNKEIWASLQVGKTVLVTIYRRNSQYEATILDYKKAKGGILFQVAPTHGHGNDWIREESLIWQSANTVKQS